jgi:ribose-phosphate pyrophosphokinase
MATNLVVLSGNANLPLAEAVAARLDLLLADRVLERYPDGELQVEIRQSVRGRDVYLIQSLSPPVESHLLELLLLADACRRAGAARVTAVLPYCGYARQDRRVRGREALGARVIADLLETAGFARVVAVDLHTRAIEGFFATPLEHLSAVPLLAEAARDDLPKDAIVVAPDLGAVRLAERFARSLALPMAIVHKTRVSGAAVSVTGLVGEVRGRAPVLVDDMVSTGGTIEAAARALLHAGARPDVTIVTSHALFVGPAVPRLAAVGPRRLLASDSVLAQSGGLPVERAALAPLLANAISCLHEERALSDLVLPEVVLRH